MRQSLHVRMMLCFAMHAELYQSAGVGLRKEEVVKFNNASRWHKRGITMVPLRFLLDWATGVPYTVFISIYLNDGTVAIAHGGVEIGQGINTKVSGFSSEI